MCGMILNIKYIHGFKVKQSEAIIDIVELVFCKVFLQIEA